MGMICCKQEHYQEHTVLSHYRSKPTGAILAKEVKSQFRLCSAKKRRKSKMKRRFRKRCSREEKPIISSPMLLNPKYLTDDKWHNVIFTIPDPRMKTRTPIPPPRKKRQSLINLCTKRNKSVEYMNLWCDEDVYEPIRGRSYTSEPDLTQWNTSRRFIRTKRSVSHENVSTKTEDKSRIQSRINRCLFCYLSEIMSRLEQLCGNNELKMDDDVDDDHYHREETLVSEVNEQKLLESLENFCVHCYLNKIQTHPLVGEMSSTSTKVEENNLKSPRTGEHDNFSPVNESAGPLGGTYETNFMVESACANSSQSFHYSLDKKCLFCSVNKTKEKHLFGVYSKKQTCNVFNSDSINEEQCKYTIGNRAGNKIRDEKSCEINNARTHKRSNMLERFKNLNCCRRRHLNLFKFMCSQCFYVYVQILYILQSSALFEEDFPGSLFKMRKCEIMRELSIQEIRDIVEMVLQIHLFFNNNRNESRMCKPCGKILSVNNVPDSGKFEKINVDDPDCNFENNNLMSPSEGQFNEGFILNDNTDLNTTESKINLPGNKGSNLESCERNDSIIRKMSKTIKQKPVSTKQSSLNGNTKEKETPKDDKTSKGKTCNKTPKPDVTKTNARNENKTIQKLENPTLKEKFEKLKADLHAKKIQDDSTKETTNLNLDNNDDVTDLHKNSPEGSKQKQKIDTNGNYLEESVRGPSKDSKTQDPIFTRDHTIKYKEIITPNIDLKDSGDKFKDEIPKYFVRGNSIRKSYKLKCSDNSNVLQIPDFESRRSSVTDSLYELEASLYDMLQNSMNLEDVEYV